MHWALWAPDIGNEAQIYIVVALLKAFALEASYLIYLSITFRERPAESPNDGKPAPLNASSWFRLLPANLVCVKVCAMIRCSIFSRSVYHFRH